jgi:hypothetical protein
VVRDKFPRFANPLHRCYVYITSVDVRIIIRKETIMKTGAVFSVLIISAFVFVSAVFDEYTSVFACEAPLRTEEAKPADVSGTYTLILYGGRYPDDLETVAILDPEGDKYHFDIYAPDFDYKTEKGVSGKEAIKEAQKFVSFHRSFFKSVLSRILDNKGDTIGYELRPLYNPLTYGFSDLINVNYFLKENGRIKVVIRLVPSVERMRFPAGAGHGDRGN